MAMLTFFALIKNKNTSQNRGLISLQFLSFEIIYAKHRKISL